MDTVFDSSGLPAADRLEKWTEVTALSLVATEFTLSDPEKFAVRLSTASLGVAQLTELSYGPLLSRRTPKLIRRSDPELCQVALIRQGSQGIDQNRTNALLHPAQLVFYDSSLPFDAWVGPQVPLSQSLLLQFPRGLLSPSAMRIGRLFARPLDGSTGMGRVLAEYLSTVAGVWDTLTEADRARAGHTAVDLATAVAAHHLDAANGQSSAQSPDLLFRRIVSFIDKELHLPDLTPAAVAAAHSISVRYLHLLFQRQGTTVAGYVRRQRIGRCRRDLADPQLSHLTIAAIARHRGFSEPSGFNRSFRAETGMTPGEYRALVRKA
ncbi:helix-turn-helix domain-containing protein [Streptomyces sp. NPDC050149]|uniref:AraC-like ligand-binding domain-containing protein n=1 Tax=Streptomyces sp. NPDC050149 TaxID=3365603 RepID=UPI0037A7E898